MTVIDRVIGLLSPSAALRRATNLIEQKKFAEAFPLLALAARAGIPDAQYHVAQCYLQGTGVPLSPSEGAVWLHRAANNACVEAQCLLGALYVHGLVRAPSDAVTGQSPFQSIVRRGRADATGLRCRRAMGPSSGRGRLGGRAKLCLATS